MENRNWKVLSCEFNTDTACVEVCYVDCNSDGKMMSNVLSIYCPAVEDQFAENMYERSELTWLVYNSPVDYVNLLLHGDMREYLNKANGMHVCAKCSASCMDTPYAEMTLKAWREQGYLTIYQK